MKTRDDIERLLSEAPRPRVVAGPHRDYLTAKLLQSMPEENPMRTDKVTKWRMGLAACCIATLLTAGSWAAYDRYSNFFVVEEETGGPVVNPDGSISIKSRMVLFGGNNPDLTQEDANQEWQQVKAAVVAGNYRLVEIQENEPGQPDCIIYEVTLEDGRTVGCGTSEPLPELEDD